MGKPFSQPWLPALFLTTALFGCGGGNGGSSASVARDASMDYSVEWPQRGRAMPVTANSAVVSVSYKGRTVDRFVFERPDATGPSLDHHVFQNLPAAELTVTVSAFPEPHGAGTAVAVGTAPVALRKGEVAQQAASLASTAAKLELTATPTTVAKGELGALTLTAKDAKDQLVPLRVDAAEEAVTWGSDDEAVATAEGGAQFGKFMGAGAGSTNVWAKFNGLKASANVTVTAPVRTLRSVLITPGYMGSIDPRDWELTATAYYDDDTSENVTSQVSWSKSPSMYGGTASISASGLFHWENAFNDRDRVDVTATLNGVSSPPALVEYRG